MALLPSIRRGYELPHRAKIGYKSQSASMHLLFGESPESSTTINLYQQPCQQQFMNKCEDSSYPSHEVVRHSFFVTIEAGAFLYRLFQTFQLLHTKSSASRPGGGGENHPGDTADFWVTMGL